MVTIPRHQNENSLLLKNIVSSSAANLHPNVFVMGPWKFGRVISKTQKMVLDAILPDTQHYKVQIKDKVEQSREKSSALSYTLV